MTFGGAFSQCLKYYKEDCFSIVKSLFSKSIYQDNLPEIRKRYEPGPMIPLLVKAVSEKFTTEDMAATISKYFEENSVQGAERNLAQVRNSLY